MDFFDEAGPMAIGSRLRMLTDTITKDAGDIYKMYGVDIRPKWFPVFFVLRNGECKTITGIAREIGHTHPSVSNIVKEMQLNGLIEEVKDMEDRRRNVISLTEKGKHAADVLDEQCADVAAVVADISEQTRNDLWRAISEWEYLLAEKSLFERVREQKLAREKQYIKIVQYKAEYRDVFRMLNEQWITSHWKMEAADYRCLDHPEEYILDKGGYIFIALYKDEPAGVCALCKMDSADYDYELAKYAVRPDMQGRGIGMALGRAVIDKARENGARKVFLESNTLLKPAIHIYRKLGFRELSEYHPSYARGDIQMELVIR